jgi:hypothetical protein
MIYLHPLMAMFHMIDGIRHEPVKPVDHADSEG